MTSSESVRSLSNGAPAGTRKRKQARARRAACQPVSTSNKLWVLLEESLCGLLTVEIDNSGTCLEHFCPRNVKLIVRLDVIRAGANDKVERVMQKVLHAVGVLCGLADSRVETHAQAFWTRVAVSPMMMSSPWDAWLDHTKIRAIAAFTQEHGLHVVLSWQSCRFQSHAADAIGVFLQSPRRKYPQALATESSPQGDARLVRLGLQFVGCKLEPNDLVRVMQALAVPELTSESDFHDVPLCGARTLQSLELKASTLGFASLDALSVGLADPHTRRVDDMRLENMVLLPTTPTYVLAFKRVLVAVLQAKHSDSTGSSDGGLALSLADNDKIQSVHIEALQEALAVATRPLAALSVAGIPGGDVETWLQLRQILFESSGTQFTPDCELDVSLVSNEEDAVETLSRSLTNIVAALLRRVSAALLASVPVYCRVHEPSRALYPHEEYQVVRVRSSGQSLSGWLSISTPSGVESATWVSCSSIRSLRIGDDDVVRCRFARLLMNGDANSDYEHYHEASNRAVLALARLIGHGLQQLTLGSRENLPTVFAAVMKACPNVQRLCLVNMYFDHGSPWTLASHHRSIQAISLNQCTLSDKSVTSLLSMLAHSRDHTLRYLDLRIELPLETETLAALLELVEANRKLVCVDIYSQRFALRNDDPSREHLRSQLQAVNDYLATERLSADTKMAFLSVVRHLNYVHFGDDVVRKVFDLSRPNQVVRWNNQDSRA